MLSRFSRCGIALALLCSATSAEDHRLAGNLDRLVRMATGDDEQARQDAIKGLREAGSPAWRALRDALEDADVGWRAAEALARVGKPALPVLIDAVKTEGTYRGRENLLHALVLLGDAAVPSLVAELNRRPADDQAQIVEALGFMGPLASAAKPALQARLGTRNLDVYAAVALTKVGSSTEEAATVLARHVMTSCPLCQRSCRVDSSVVGALARSGGKSRSALPALRTALRKASQADRIDLLRAKIPILLRAENNITCAWGWGYVPQVRGLTPAPGRRKLLRDAAGGSRRRTRLTVPGLRLRRRRGVPAGAA